MARARQIIKKVRAKTMAIGRAAGTLAGGETRFRTAQAVRAKRKKIRQQAFATGAVARQKKRLREIQSL